MSTAPLEMRFDMNTLQHLGIKMYTQIPAALSELIANAYDADATEVHITIDKKEIVVEDNGGGMTFEEVNNNFLVIGRDRRKDGDGLTKLGRRASGKKGLGKLALFGIGGEITIRTTKQGSGETLIFTLNWEDIKESETPYNPPHKNCPCQKTCKGTTVTITKLKRTSKINIEDTAKGIARRFEYDPADFKVTIVDRNEQDNEITITKYLLFEGLKEQFRWEIPLSDEDQRGDKKQSNGFERESVKGFICTSAEPITESGLKGVLLYARGRLINGADASDFFGVPSSSHFYRYVTGILHADFIDEGHGDDDLIATNRESIDWSDEKMVSLKSDLQDILRNIGRRWRERRQEKQNEKVEPPSEDGKWISTFPTEKRKDFKELVVWMNDQDEEQRREGKELLEKIVPQYPEFHWRFLDGSITKEPTVEEKYRR